jgi:hypothetical protein
MSDSYVYLNGERLAYQHNMHWSEAEASGQGIDGVFGKQVRWLYREPIIQTESWHYRVNWNSPNQTQDWSYETFVDPTGSVVSTVDPATIPPPIPPVTPPILNLRYNGENHYDWDGACVVDGRPMACDRAMRLLSSGAGYLYGHGRYTHNIVPTSRGTYFLHLLADTGEGRHVDDYSVNFLQTQQQDDGGRNKRTDCAKFVDNLVEGNEAARRQGVKDNYEKATYTGGHALLEAARRAAGQLGTMTFTGFQARLTRGDQNDGVYQHVLAHAGATMIGNRPLVIPYSGSTTGGVTAYTGTELTNLALKQDEYQRDHPTETHPRAQAEAEIAGDHAGRVVGGLLMRGLSGTLGGAELRQALFRELCQN